MRVTLYRPTHHALLVCGRPIFKFHSTLNPARYGSTWNHSKRLVKSSRSVRRFPVLHFSVPVLFVALMRSHGVERRVTRQRARHIQVSRRRVSCGETAFVTDVSSPIVVQLPSSFLTAQLQHIQQAIHSTKTSLKHKQSMRTINNKT